MTQRLIRPYLTPSGLRIEVLLLVCTCGRLRHGPEGGVCGACGSAIPSPEEQFSLERSTNQRRGNT